MSDGKGRSKVVNTEPSDGALPSIVSKDKCGRTAGGNKRLALGCTIGVAAMLTADVLAGLVMQELVQISQLAW